MASFSIPSSSIQAGRLKPCSRYLKPRFRSHALFTRLARLRAQVWAARPFLGQNPGWQFVPGFVQFGEHRLTPGSTRTPPALPSALSQHFAISASFSASAQAVPVSLPVGRLSSESEVERSAGHYLLPDKQFDARR